MRATTPLWMGALAGVLCGAALVGCKKAERVDPLDRPIGVRDTVSSGVLDQGVRWIVDEDEALPLTVRVSGNLGWAAEDGAAGASRRIAAALGPDGQAPDVRIDRFEVELPVDRREEPPDALEKAFAELAGWACCLTADEVPVFPTVFRPDWPELGWDDPAIVAAVGAEPDPATKEEIASAWSDRVRGSGLVVAVTGDVRAKTVRKALQRALKEWEPAETAVETPSFQVSDEPTVRVSTGSSLVVWLPVDAPQVETRGGKVRDLRRGLRARVGLQVLKTRLSTAIPGVSIDIESLAPGESAIVVSVDDAQDLQAIRSHLDTLLVELRRIEQWGILNSEIRRAESAVLDAESVDPGEPDADARVTELVAHVLDGVPIPDAARQTELVERYARTFTVDEITGWAKARVRGPRTWVVPLDEADVLALDAKSRTLDTAPPVDRGDLEHLAARPDGEVVDLDDGVATLPNGMTVRVERMDGPLVIRAVRPGGLAGFADSDRLAVSIAIAAAEKGALGEHDPATVTRFLAQKGVQVRASVHEQHTAIAGQVRDPSDPDAIRTAFELLHLRFTAPPLDEKRVATEVERRRLELARNLDSPLFRFDEAWSTEIWPDDPARLPVDNAALDEVDAATAQAAYEALFGDPAAWTIVLTGAAPDDIGSSIAAWLGSIPAAEEPRDVAVRDRGFTPDTPGSVELVAGQQGVGYLRIAWFGDAPEALAGSEEVFVDFLRARLVERLRPERPGLYGLDVDLERSGPARDQVRVEVAISGHPSRLDALVEDALSMSAEAKEAEVSTLMYDALAARDVARRTGRSEAPGSHADQLAREALGLPVVDAPFPEDPEALAALLEPLTVLLDEDRRVVGRLSPEPDAVISPAPPTWKEARATRDMLDDPPVAEESEESEKSE